ncbi:MAG: hypothetical protein A4E73_00052 [Syntrophaceae bacterium PtaU1.Bin231]|nr:MAG: hypothetical protein A4E73_00052 [Syntrophaceae bacterium PtaU1.Bin231]
MRRRIAAIQRLCSRSFFRAASMGPMSRPTKMTRPRGGAGGSMGGEGQNPGGPRRWKSGGTAAPGAKRRYTSKVSASPGLGIWRHCGRSSAAIFSRSSSVP